MRHAPWVGTLVAVVLSGAAGSSAHEVGPVCGLAVLEEERARDTLALDVELARSDLVAAQEVFDLLEDLWEGEATERMRYLAGRYARDSARAELARTEARLARQEAYLAWLTAVCGRRANAATERDGEIERDSEARYLVADCGVRRQDIEVARVDQEWAATWLESIRDLREHDVATRPDIIEAEYAVRKAEQRVEAAKARAGRCQPSSREPGKTP